MILLTGVTLWYVQLALHKSGAILEIDLRVGVIPSNVTYRHILLTIFSQFILTKSSEASSISFICCILYKPSLNSPCGNVWTHKTTNYLSRNYFTQVKGWSRDHCDL